MNNAIETIYILENPEKNMVKFATDYQLRYDDIIKEVFGVACLNDLCMMIQFNKSFQESICNKYGISDHSITLNRIIRIASKNDMLQLKKQLLEKMEQEMDFSPDTETSIPCPFDTVIKLADGIFKWDEMKSAYCSA